MNKLYLFLIIGGLTLVGCNRDPSNNDDIYKYHDGVCWYYRHTYGWNNWYYVPCTDEILKKINN